MGFVGFFDFGMHALDGCVGNLADGLHCASVENCDKRGPGSALTRIEEVSVARKGEGLGAEGDRGGDLVERGVEENNLRCGAGNELRGEAGAIGIRGYERYGSCAEAVRTSDGVAICVEDR